MLVKVSLSLLRQWVICVSKLRVNGSFEKQLNTIQPLQAPLEPCQSLVLIGLIHVIPVKGQGGARTGPGKPALSPSARV